MTRSPVVLLYGAPGVGKTRLAMEAVERFAGLHSGTTILYIVDRGRDLSDELRSRCAEDGSYVLLVDDANQLSGFRNVIDLFRTQRPARMVRVLATVRGYALHEVRAKSEEFLCTEPIRLGELKDDQIREFIRDEFEIKNHLYQEHILAIAQGNPRIAAMASSEVRQANGWKGFKSVPEIYRGYFGRALNDVVGADEEQLLKVAAMYSLFRSIEGDRFDEKVLPVVLPMLEMTEDQFWAATTKLHRMEIVNMFSASGPARISDQSLAVYLFHEVVFQRKLIPLHRLLTVLYPNRRSRFADILNPVLQIFGTAETIACLKQEAGIAIDHFESIPNDRTIQQLHEAFWAADVTRALLYAERLVDSLKHEASETRLDFGPRNSGYLPEQDALQVLVGCAQSHDAGDRRTALELIILFLKKQPSKAPQVAQSILRAFEIDDDAFAQEYTPQHQITDTLVELSENGANEQVSGLFFVWAAEALRTQYWRIKSTRNRNEVSSVVHVPHATQRLSDLRSKLWSYAFSLFDRAAYQEDVFKLLKTYRESWYHNSDKDLLVSDMALITAFIRKNLDPNSLEHCLLVQEFARTWRIHEVPFDSSLKNDFENEELRLVKFLAFDHSLMEDEAEHEPHQDWQRRLTEYGSCLSPNQISNFLGLCAGLKRHFGPGGPWSLTRAIELVLLGTYDEFDDEFALLIEQQFQCGNKLGLMPEVLMQRFIESKGLPGTLAVIDASVFQFKWFWTLEYFNHAARLAPTEALAKDYEERVLTATESKLFVRPLMAMPFEAVRPGLLVRVVEHLVSRLKSDDSLEFPLGELFREGKLPLDSVVAAFDGRMDLLERLFFELNARHGHSADQKRTLRYLVDKDPSYTKRWVQWRYERSGHIGPSEEEADFTFVWERKDLESIMDGMLDTAWQMKKPYYGPAEYPLSLFSRKRGKHPDETHSVKQDAYLKSRITMFAGMPERLRFLFGIVNGLPEERRLSLTAFLLQYGPSEKFFREVALEHSMGVLINAGLTRPTSRLAYYRALRQHCVGVDTLKYKVIIDKAIEHAESDLTEARVEEFVDA